jgi:hypothetical protein
VNGIGVLERKSIALFPDGMFTSTMRFKTGVFVVVALAFIGWLWWWNQPERVLKRRFASLIEAVNIPDGSGGLLAANRAEGVGEYLADDVDLAGPIDETQGHFSRSSLKSMYAGLAQYSKKVQFSDPEVTNFILKDDTHATQQVRFTAHVNGPEGILLDGTQKATVSWEKVDKLGWVLTQATWTD